MTQPALSRRSFVAASGAAALVAATPAFAQQRAAMARVILDNDFSGDPDGLFQLAHHLLSPAVDIPLIVGSHLPGDMRWTASKATASDARAKARELIRLLGQDRIRTVLGGSETAIAARYQWQPSPATAAIIAEAMREDPREQLVYAAGAGLTELALAWLQEPRIGKRIRLIWIGGAEHPGLAYPPPGPEEMEFNFSIDPLAAQIVFNESDIEVWQVPRNVYRQMLVSEAELDDIAQTGAVGRYLKAQLDDLAAQIAKIAPVTAFPRSETYVLGDSPLVTLTALQSFFQPDTTSSPFRIVPTPRLDAQGDYADNPGGRPMRVYTEIDTRLTFGDMVSKFRAFGKRQSRAG